MQYRCKAAMSPEQCVTFNPPPFFNKRKALRFDNQYGIYANKREITGKPYKHTTKESF
jgi:hypothetical protein